MKKYCLLIVLLCFVSVIHAEEKNSRENYQSLYQGLSITNAIICEQEGKLRTGKIGLGLSGSFTFEFKNWGTTPLMDGFIDLDVNFWLAPHMNIAAYGGYHKTEAESVYPLSLMVQWVGPSFGSMDRTPGIGGIEAGIIYFASSVAGEPVLCFKVGFCTYQFVNEYFAFTGNIDYITPSFRNNNLETKFGVRYFLH